MRILAGQYKGRLLTMPRGIRPTQGKVRKAILDTLGERIVEARCLDLYAGSGAVGFEMLSWGAAHVTFVEQHPISIRTILENAQGLASHLPKVYQRFGFERRSSECETGVEKQPGAHGLFSTRRPSASSLEQETHRLHASGVPGLPVQIIRDDVLRAIPRLAATGERFDVIFFDPPYSQGLIADCLQTLDHHVIVAANFHLIVQGFWRDQFPEDFRCFQQQKLVRYGDTTVAWYGPT